ncbi:hypothetical protein HK097_000731, partial [Rhizophlyctis rosea]
SPLTTRPLSQISQTSTQTSHPHPPSRSKLDELMGTIFSEIGNATEVEEPRAENLPAGAAEPTGTGAGKKAMWAEKSRYFMGGGGGERREATVVRPPSPKPQKVNPETFDVLVSRLERVMEKHKR